MKIKDIALLTIVVLFVVPLLIVIGTVLFPDKEIRVSLPEEIMQAKKGDTLIVEKVSDSVYIGFKPKRK